MEIMSDYSKFWETFFVQLYQVTVSDFTHTFSESILQVHMRVLLIIAEKPMSEKLQAPLLCLSQSKSCIQNSFLHESGLFILL